VRLTDTNPVKPRASSRARGRCIELTAIIMIESRLTSGQKQRVLINMLQALAVLGG
jgi:hypothetical protein